MTLRSHITSNSVFLSSSSSKFAYLLMWTAPRCLWWRQYHICWRSPV